MQILNIGTLALTLFQAAQIGCYDFMVKKPVKYNQPFVCPCEYNFDPVCGSDGVTYTNRCLLECYSNNGDKTGQPPVTECTDGVTCSDCVCQSIHLPVCSMSGQTYPNECELSCENHRRAQGKRPLEYLAYRAACLGPPGECSTIASPVCGSDNIQYRNLCELNCANGNAKTKGLPPIEFKNVGACLDACQCPDMQYPVCGSDGIQYDNLCEIACQNRQQNCSLSGPVMPAPTKTCQPCICSAEYNPVCGSDRTYGELEARTFSSPCELNCEAKRTNNPNLRVIGFGECPSCFCTGQYLPVCGTDCQTYTNECELRCANNRRPKSDPAISMFHSGPCQVEDCDCSHCDTEYMPVCGSDDLTYWNLCWLNCNSDCSKKQSGKQIYMAKRGSCSL
ncbi:serine protease inhibitor dipetalogastin-like [Maniola jurtina]|uniref:serine protease inhibitor dipetalogastin-like n=1 Tax=Maniola jurtina TaxID=191418 RepID=UPI001E68ED7F|nr:serine protease inhibitor dipetalogastin-like [Maniola jurtina]